MDVGWVALRLADCSLVVWMPQDITKELKINQCGDGARDEKGCGTVLVMFYTP
ncbi:hypothetical protein NEUTE1DRAFT_116987 [Neurospora tetrasperma FGSC 2508]|uniref:Uncharacterized protein n=1 Tax=Neurospora tetrasperma (strain FGSC 2508 / ATCC MYA-4615 / P0657) TaxID=510951 RepID=F8MMN4_NEUT8|nr:uncharacterized protein NEUTE1DRAFT_116987 [Neurospora tetrasperma FGSC 2508]EGO57908.1 hypothetical protein NEUTE1DRAFT_116987 [Neurospora tetrasperma FGSC 2508]EGZ71805.1 hypothetical protein NEUTE2DRAFT_144621 [Neurospora tetrasperma FGSC 2509]